MPLSQAKHTRIVFLVVTLFVITGYVYAGGGAEDPFAEVKLLFAEKKYAEAMPLLSEILKDNPDLYDEVDTYYQTFLVIRKEISSLEEGIIDDIKNENPEGIFEKIGLMRELEPFPDESNRDIRQDT